MILAELEHIIELKYKDKQLKIIYEAIARQAKLEKWGDYFVEEFPGWVSPDWEEQHYSFNIKNNIGEY